MATREQQLAEAFVSVARLNHYMVGITDKLITVNECNDAEQILIKWQNALPQADFPGDGGEYDVLNLALGFLEHFRDSLPDPFATSHYREPK